MTKTPSRPPPPARQSLPLVHLTRPPPLSLHPPPGVRANGTERSISHQRNHRVPNNRHKSYRTTKHAQTHRTSTVRRLTRQEQPDAFFLLIFVLIIILALLSPSLPAAPQIRGHIAVGPSPLLPTTVRGFIFIARRIQCFLPSSTRVELYLPTLLLRDALTS